MNKEVVKIGRYIEFEHENGTYENMLLLNEKETNAMEKQLKKSYEYEQQIQELTNNWNELEEWVKEKVNEDWDFSTGERNACDAYDNVLDKMKEIKGNDEIHK
jgi:hypothetical protein